ncbi:MAG: biopolymer transporter ExbD, partial [Betaproteobacteria bacterium]|nr:biopolymer transporter ExbD [Betaproteobacteria bacterium]
MAFGSMDNSNRQMPTAEINVVPLVDVMLVLLVIFIITAPLLTHSVKIDLPKAASSPNITQPDHIEFALRDDASLFWNGEPVTMDQLAPRFAASVKENP